MEARTPIPACASGYGLNDDRPASGLYCAERCLFYGMAPLLHAGITAGVEALEAMGAQIDVAQVGLHPAGLNLPAVDDHLPKDQRFEKAPQNG